MIYFGKADVKRFTTYKISKIHLKLRTDLCLLNSSRVYFGTTLDRHWIDIAFLLVHWLINIFFFGKCSSGMAKRKALTYSYINIEVKCKLEVVIYNKIQEFGIRGKR